MLTRSWHLSLVGQSESTAEDSVAGGCGLGLAKRTRPDSDSLADSRRQQQHVQCRAQWRTTTTDQPRPRLSMAPQWRTCQQANADKPKSRMESKCTRIASFHRAHTRFLLPLCCIDSLIPRSPSFSLSLSHSFSLFLAESFSLPVRLCLFIIPFSLRLLGRPLLPRRLVDA